NRRRSAVGELGAPMSTPALVNGPVYAESSQGRAALDRCLPELDRFEDALGVPLTARASWARSAFAADPSLEPWTIAARGPDGSPQGSVVLGVREGPERLEISSPRPGTDDQLCFAARSASDLSALVDAIGTQIARLQKPWSARLDGLAPDAAVT